MKFAISFNSISHAILLSSPCWLCLTLTLLSCCVFFFVFFDKCRLTFYRIYSVQKKLELEPQQMLSCVSFHFHCIVVDSYEESHVNMLNYNIDITISFGQFGS